MGAPRMSEKPKKMKVVVKGDNPLVIMSGKNGLSLLLVVRDKDKLDVVKLENAIGIRMNIPNEYMPQLNYLVAKRIIAMDISARLKSKQKTTAKEVSVDELFSKAKEIEVPEEIAEEDIASLMK